MPKKEIVALSGSFEVFQDENFRPQEGTAGYRSKVTLGDLVVDLNPHVQVTITPEERDVLKKLLDRNRTSYAVHGGLKSLFVLTDDETTALLGFLERI